MGTETAPLPEQCAKTAKTSEWERAGHKPGGGGGPPPRLFASGLSLEKAWIPARDRAGNPLAGANLRRSKPGPPARGRTVLRTLRVGGTEAASGRSAPLPRLPGGGPHFSREMGRKRAGGKPPGPRLLWPLVPTRWFLGSLYLVRWWGYYHRYSKTDLGRIFPKKYAEKAFCERKSPNQGTDMGTVIVPQPPRCATQRQSRTSEQRVA